MTIKIRDDMLTCAVDRTTAETLLRNLRGEWTQADFERLIKLFDTQRSFARLMTQAAMGVLPVNIDEDGVITVGDGIIAVGNGDNVSRYWMRLMRDEAQQKDAQPNLPG